MATRVGISKRSNKIFIQQGTTKLTLQEELDQMSMTLQGELTRLKRFSTAILEQGC